MTTHDHDQPMCEARVSDDPGMTLRDWFAGQADIPWNVLHAMLVQRGEHEPTSGRVAEYRANMKYIEADAMLEARKPSA